MAIDYTMATLPFSSPFYLNYKDGEAQILAFYNQQWQLLSYSVADIGSLQPHWKLLVNELCMYSQHVNWI